MHEELIQRVMNKLLSGNDEMLKMLKNQYSCTTIKSIESSTAGFFVNFEMPSVEINFKNYLHNFQIGDVYGNVGDIEFAVGFLLFIKNSRITMLEGYTNMINLWPDDNSIDLRYDFGEFRNIAILRKQWRL